jgi:hypothetical protein
LSWPKPKGQVARWDGEELLVQDLSYEGHPSWMQSRLVTQFDRESASLPAIAYSRRVVLSEARIVTAVAKDGRTILRTSWQYEFAVGGERGRSSPLPLPWDAANADGAECAQDGFAACTQQKFCDPAVWDGCREENSLDKCYLVQQ